MDAKNKYVYKENQPFHILLVFCAVFILSFQLILIFGTDTYTSRTGIVFVYTLFVAIVLLFYRFKIVLTKTHLQLTFGVGLIKVTYSLATIDACSIQQQHVPWYIGMGIRFTPSGNWVYNTKAGQAVCFGFINQRRKVFVVAKYPDKLEKALKELI